MWKWVSSCSTFINNNYRMLFGWFVFRFLLFLRFKTISIWKINCKSKQLLFVPYTQFIASHFKALFAVLVHNVWLCFNKTFIYVPETRVLCWLHFHRYLWFTQSHVVRFGFCFIYILGQAQPLLIAWMANKIVWGLTDPSTLVNILPKTMDHHECTLFYLLAINATVLSWDFTHLFINSWNYKCFILCRDTQLSDFFGFAAEKIEPN